MHKSVIIFDFDFTLADSTKGAVTCFNHALEQMGEATRSWDECCATFGLSLEHTYEALTGNGDPRAAEEFCTHFHTHADDIWADHTILYDGVHDVLQSVADTGRHLSIFSMNARQRIHDALHRERLTHHFSMIVGGDDVAALKPDPEGLHKILDETATHRDQAVLVGDSLSDAEAARRAGIEFIAVLTGATTAAKFAEYVPRTILPSVLGLEPAHFDGEN